MTLDEHEDFEDFRKDKRARKMMDLLLKEERDQYMLKLAQEGARLPRHFDVKNILAPK